MNNADLNIETHLSGRAVLRRVAISLANVFGNCNVFP